MIDFYNYYELRIIKLKKYNENNSKIRIMTGVNLTPLVQNAHFFLLYRGLKFHLNSQSGNLSLQNTDEHDMMTVMYLHLDALISHFEKYFSEDMEKYNWIINPFLDNANAPQGFTSLGAEQFIDLTSDLTLKDIYNPNSLISFWVKATAEFPLVGCKALCVLVPFATSY